MPTDAQVMQGAESHSSALRRDRGDGREEHASVHRGSDDGGDDPHVLALQEALHQARRLQQDDVYLRRNDVLCLSRTHHGLLTLPERKVRAIHSVEIFGHDSVYIFDTYVMLRRWRCQWAW